MPTTVPARRPASVRVVPWGGVESVALGVAVVALLPAAAHLLALRGAEEWQAVVTAALQGNAGGVWRWMRGGVRWLLAPGLVVVVTWCAAVMVRRRRVGTAAAAALVGLTAFGLVEGMKHGIVPLPGRADAEPQALSGHVAAAGAALVPFVTAVRRHRVLAAALGGGVLAVVGAAVVLARWHEGQDAILAMLTVAAWSTLAAWATLAARAVVVARGVRASGRLSRRASGRTPRGPADPAPSVRGRRALACGGLGLLAVTGVGVGTGTSAGAGVPLALVAAAVGIAGAALVAASAALDLASALDPL